MKIFVNSPFAGLGKFDVILADPPWSYYGQQDKWAAAAKFYDLMPDEDLLELPVGDILNDNGIVFMWATAPRIDFAIDLLRAWGLTFRGVPFVWVKSKLDGVTPIGAQGVRPSIVKPTSEFVLAGSRVKRGRPMPISDEAVRQVVLAPKQEHSRKPDDIHESINRLYPDASKIELFARRQYPGWEAWGNEC